MAIGTVGCVLGTFESVRRIAAAMGPSSNGDHDGGVGSASGAL